MTVLAEKTEVLWVGAGPPPAELLAALAGRWEVSPARLDVPLSQQSSAAPVALVQLTDLTGDLGRLEDLLEDLLRGPTVAVLLAPPGQVSWTQELILRRAAPCLCVPADAPSAELASKLEAAAALQPAIKRLLAASRPSRDDGGPAEEKTALLDEQLQLAARLQQDFLPARLPEVGPVRFGVLFKPAGWVSGDIYDISRLDERIVSLYVADAIGHGLPAALLTMFIKKAFQTKRIFANTYHIVAPHEALGELNADICRQELSNCQFCTAVYCLIDVESLTITYASAGHPMPLLVSPDGCVAPLAGPGGPLLGVFPDETFHSARRELQRGQRLVLYSDGVLDALGSVGGDPAGGLKAFLAETAGAPRETVLLELAARVEAGLGRLDEKDDITVVIMDIEG